MFVRIRSILVLACTIFLTTPVAHAATYTIDRDHSTIGFKIRHLFSKVQGQFNDFAGTIEYEPGIPEAWKVEAVIQAASIDTNVEKRDAHLRSKDFFDTQAFPTITFRSTGVRDATPTTATLDGVLSLHGVEKPVTLDVQIHGVGKDPWGNVRAGFTGTTQITRKEFGLAWNQTLETGQLLVGDEVDLILEIEGIAR